MDGERDPLVANAATFRALARSSRRLWRSVRLTVADWGSRQGDASRAWVRRPFAYRLERLDGTLVSAESTQDSAGSVAHLGAAEDAAPEPDVCAEARALRREALALVEGLADRGTAGEDTLAVVLRARDEVERRLETEPRLLAGRLLADPPPSRPRDGVPFFVSYRWMAILEPDELADGEADTDEADAVDWFSLSPREQELRSAREVRELAVATAQLARGDLSRWDSPPLDYAAVRQVDHHGRPALEAVVKTTSAYEPRCSCCPLLPGRHALAMELQGMGAQAGSPRRLAVPRRGGDRVPRPPRRRHRDLCRGGGPRRQHRGGRLHRGRRRGRRRLPRHPVPPRLWVGVSPLTRQDAASTP